MSLYYGGVSHYDDSCNSYDKLNQSIKLESILIFSKAPHDIKSKTVLQNQWKRRYILNIFTYVTVYFVLELLGLIWLISSFKGRKYLYARTERRSA